MRIPPAFQLAQLGSFVAERWTLRLRELGLSPSEGLLLLRLAQADGPSQRELADALGIVGSRVVVLVDSLEAKGLVVRARSEHDRRRQVIRLTERGGAVMQELHRISREHQEDILSPLTEQQREELGGLLTLLAGGHGMGSGTHPGAGQR